MRTTADVAGIKPVISGKIIFADSTEMSISDRDFMANSLTFKHGTSNSGEFSVGAAIIGACSFGLMNDSGRFTGVSWYDSKVQITLTAGTVDINMGEYLVVSHKETGHVISIEAYDRMQLLDQYGLYEDNITFPSTVGTVVSTICSARGLTYSGLAYPNMALPDPGDDSMTERECISYIAQMMGQYVLVKNNVLTFGWYGSTAYNAGNTFSHDFQTADTVISGVVVKVDENTKATQGSGTVVTVENNPFINANNMNTVCTQIYNAVNGIEYRIGSASILSNLAIEAGDRILVRTGRDVVICLATQVTYKPQVQMPIVSDGPSVSDLRLSPTERIKQIANQQSNKTISDQLADSSSPLSQAIATGGGGGSSAKKTGGANNQYGTYKNYNASNMPNVEIDNTGMKLGRMADLDMTVGFSGTVMAHACTEKKYMASEETIGNVTPGTVDTPTEFRAVRTNNHIKTERHYGARDTDVSPQKIVGGVDFVIPPNASGAAAKGSPAISSKIVSQYSSSNTAKQVHDTAQYENHFGNQEMDSYVSPDPSYNSTNFMHGVTALLGLLRMDQARIYSSGAWYPGMIIQNTQTTPSGSTATYCAVWLQGFPAGASDSGVTTPVIYIQACDYRGIVNRNAQKYKIELATV